VIENAPSARSKCKGCGKAIAKGEVRFGERMPNAFGEGEMTLWFHPLCAAHMRPDAVLEHIADPVLEAALRESMRSIAQAGLKHHRLPRIAGAERAPSGRARCRACRELIEKSDWRVTLTMYQEGMFNPMGFVHVRCAGTYFETKDIESRLLHFASDLDERERESLRRALTA
jgi:hypothetical protein